MARAAGGAEYVTDGIILRAVTTGEADRVITLMTRAFGKVAAVARSAQKSRSRFGGALSAFVVGQATLRERRGSELMTLESFDALHDFTAIANDPVTYAHASYATELVRELSAPRHADVAAFELLAELYETVATHAPASDTLRAFELRLLDDLGLRPVLDRCLGCGADDDATLDTPGAVLDPSLGGLRCFRCAALARGAGIRPLPAPARRRLLELADAVLSDAASITPLPGEHAARAREALHALLAAHLPGPLRTLEFIQQLRHPT
jgi:DNA repair protein RecO (recombination protein O)